MYDINVMISMWVVHGDGGDVMVVVMVKVAVIIL